MALSPLFPTLWSARITYFAGQFSAFLPNATRQWEGEATVGNRVNIPTVDRSVALKDYSRVADLDAPEDIDATTQTLTIDQEKYFNFAIEDLDARQSNIPGATLIDIKSGGAGLAIANDIDGYVGGLLNAIPDGNLLHNVAVADAQPFDLKFSTQMNKLLTIRALQSAGYVVIAPPEIIEIIDNGIIDKTYGDVVIGARFLEALGMDPAATTNGFAFTIGRNRYYASNNATLRYRSDGSATAITNADRGDGSVMYAYNPLDLALIMQVNKTEAYRPQKRFSSAIKGLVNYGSRVLNAGRVLKFRFTDA